MALDDGNLFADVDYEDVLEMASCVDGFYAIEMDTYGSTWTAYRARRREKYDKSKRHRVFAGHG